MTAVIYREAERQQGMRCAGPLAHLVDEVAAELHGLESLHLHDASGPVERCGYCYLRAGRTLGVIARRASELAPQLERAEIPALRAEVASQAAAVERVRALHNQGLHHRYKGVEVCRECGLLWPCPTLRALDGGALDAPIGYMVCIRNDVLDRWEANWDGEVHPTREAALAALAECRASGYEAVIAALHPDGGAS